MTELSYPIITRLKDFHRCGLFRIHLLSSDDIHLLSRDDIYSLYRSRLYVWGPQLCLL